MGSGCVPHTISMTKRWGPVGFMRVGGMGLGAAPSPVGFPDFASYQTAVIASFPPCPPPFDPVCENPRDAAITQALIQWKLNPQSCGNIVCDASGNPQITPAPGGSGSGYNTNTGFVPVSTSGPSYTPASPARHRPTYLPRPLPPAPPQPSVVNPSPPTLLTTTGSSTTAPGSLVNQANGTVPPICVQWDPTNPDVCQSYSTASTVGGYVSPPATTTSSDLIAGVPNWVLFVGGGFALLLLARMK